MHTKMNAAKAIAKKLLPERLKNKLKLVSSKSNPKAANAFAMHEVEITANTARLALIASNT
jgi:hypothetical protein